MLAGKVAGDELVGPTKQLMVFKLTALMLGLQYSAIFYLNYMGYFEFQSMVLTILEKK